MTDDGTGAPAWLVVDVMNVIGSRPDGWWRDRRGAIRDFLARLQVHADTTGARITAVVDSHPIDGAGGGDGLEIVYAGREPDAADDRIVDLLGASDDLATVVTADRDLRARAAERGASLAGPRTLLDRLDEHDLDTRT